MMWRKINYYIGYVFIFFSGASIVMGFCGHVFPAGFMVIQAIVLAGLGALRIARWRE